MRIQGATILRAIMKCGLFLFGGSSLFVSSGCVLSFVGNSIVIAGNVSPLEVGLRQTMVVLEDGENSLASSAVDYRQALNRILEALPPGTPEFVRSDITTFLKRVPDTGADFECGPEFMRYRTRQELERVKDKLLNTTPDHAEPQFCYAIPFAIDLAQPVKGVDIFGYDLDTQPLELFVVNNDGSFDDVSFALSRRTHYHLTVDLGKNGVKFTAQSQMLGVAWGHLIRYSVVLIQPTTALCLSQIEEIPAGKTITFSPLLIGGSGRLGRGGNVRASAMLNYESNKVDATVCMMAADEEPDPTTFAGCGVEYVYTTEPDRIIEGVLAGLESRTSQIPLNRGQNVTGGRRDGPVTAWKFVVSNPQSRASEPMVTVVLRKIRIASTKLDNCLPAVAYLEARRTSAIAPGTLKRLDSESRGLQREILKLRPRFAPQPN
jgi:hypothetical protein